MNGTRPDHRSPAEQASQSILVINPNSNPAVTELIRKAAQRALPSGTRAVAMNPPAGPHSIQSARQKAEAVPQVLEMVHRIGVGKFGAIAMGCFDDLALEELRDCVSIPVVGTFEAGLLHVRSYALRFGVVTTFHGAIPGIRKLLERYGAGDCVSLRAAGVGVAAAAQPDPGAIKKVEAAVREAVEIDGARAILLGSGGLTGWAERVEAMIGVPVIDGVETAIRVAGALVHKTSMDRQSDEVPQGA